MLKTESPLETLAVPARGLQINPFLHVDEAAVYDPLTDRTLRPGEAGYADLRTLLAGNPAPLAALAPEARALLARGGWLLPAGEDPAQRFRLKYVSLEAHTVCNQACYFCPVSIAPREDYFMPTELYERIVGELGAFRETHRSGVHDQLQRADGRPPLPRSGADDQGRRPRRRRPHQRLGADPRPHRRSGRDGRAALPVDQHLDHGPRALQARPRRRPSAGGAAQPRLR